jgi:flavin-dependent dehydrogenase
MYDVIVVGARCAGASTALLLARKGHRVLLVDRSTFPSDLRLSTHLVWQPGVAALKRWGLLDELAGSGCPPITTATLDVGPFTLTGAIPAADGVREAYAPRRTVLDALLVNAAVQAGAELWEGCTVDELLTDVPGARVRGIRGRTRGGQAVTATATVVVGATGCAPPPPPGSRPPHTWNVPHGRARTSRTGAACRTASTRSTPARTARSSPSRPTTT